MSQRALHLAVRDYLREQLELSEAECDVMFDGQPPPACGERFVAIHAGEWSATDVEGMDESYGVSVTVTRRITYAPMDRAVNPLTGTDGAALDKLLEAIRAKMHLDAQGDAIINAANVIIGSGANGFVEPPRFRSGGRPEPQGAAWFSSDGEAGDCGIAQTLSFGGARRVQTIESAT